MEPSPLTQQARPEVFQPKITQLYQQLFQVRDEPSLSEGFWSEFFLLPPDKGQFRAVVDGLSADDVFLAQDQTRDFFERAVEEIRQGSSPQDSNALENLTAFLGSVLSKRYMNPSSDIIAVLAGLDRVDKLVSELVTMLDSLIRDSKTASLRFKAVETTLALTAGAYQTGLTTYLTHRDLFPSIMKFVREVDDPSLAFKPMLLLSLLANYNKFEFQNPYQSRLEDFVNEPTMQSIVRGIGTAAARARDAYVLIHDDTPEGWNLNSALTYVGLRSLTPESTRKKPPPTEEEAKKLFAALPTVGASILLPTYSFVAANKMFASTLISSLSPSPSSPPTTIATSTETPLAALLSLTSYLSHHAHRSDRSLQYNLLALLTFLNLVEDSQLLTRLSSPASNSNKPNYPIRLCRQRPPFPPPLPATSPPTSTMLLIMASNLTHNLRRRLSVPLYSLTLSTTLRILTGLSRAKIRLAHPYPHLWAACFSVLRFLTQYSTDLQTLPEIRELVCLPLTQILAFSLAAGDSFLPEPSAYDDLGYKLVEFGPETLTRFRDAYFSPHSAPLGSPLPTTTSSTTTTAPGHPVSRISKPINTLISIATHFSSLLQSSGKKGSGGVTPRAVKAVIRDGYESLDLNDAGEGLGEWEPFREGSGQWKGVVKRIVRGVVEDARGL